MRHCRGIAALIEVCRAFIHFRWNPVKGRDGMGETWLAQGETGQQEWGKGAASVSNKQAVSIPRSRSRVTAVLNGRA